jgi:hypothetical protein
VAGRRCGASTSWIGSPRRRSGAGSRIRTDIGYAEEVDVKIERREASDGSGNYALVITDDAGRPVEIQEYDKDGNVLQRVYAEGVENDTGP